MAIVGLGPAGVAAPLLYTLAIPLVLLPWRRALPAIAYAVAWGTVALAAPIVVKAPTDVPMWLVTALAYLVFGGSTLALLGVVAAKLEQSYRLRERRLRYENALAACGNALLATTDDEAIDVALQALLPATPDWATSTQPRPMRTLCPICTRLSIFAPAPMTVSGPAP